MVRPKNLSGYHFNPIHLLRGRREGVAAEISAEIHIKLHLDEKERPILKNDSPERIATYCLHVCWTNSWSEKEHSNRDIMQFLHAEVSSKSA